MTEIQKGRRMRLYGACAQNAAGSMVTVGSWFVMLMLVTAQSCLLAGEGTMDGT